MSASDDDDLLAAEYVLGTLDAEERAAVERRMAAEDRLLRSVRNWEDLFSPLLGLYQDVAPPEAIRTAVFDMLGSTDVDASETGSNILLLKRSVRRWRVVAGGALALAAALAVWIVVGPEPGRTSRFVAVLQKDATSPAILLDVDIAARRAEIRQVANTQPVGKSYELWLINPEVGAPKSLGVLRAQGVTGTSLASFDAAVIARATYAITEEPQGGSLNGVPSGPPVLTGRLVDGRP